MPTVSRPRSPRRGAAALGVAATIIACLLTTAAPAGGAPRAPSTVLPTDRVGVDVAISPRAVRAADGTAELDVEVGRDAPGDVVVELALRTPEVADDGTVGIGAAVPPGTVTAGSRLRPGERLRVTVRGLEVPTLVVADVTAVGGPPAASRPAALVLPGAAGPPPTLTLVAIDDTVEVTVDVARPLLVSLGLRGAQETVLPDRLVLPDTPLTLSMVPARWPVPSEVVVTDETGRTSTATTGSAPLVGLAVTLLLVAAAGLVALRRRRRALSQPVSAVTSGDR